MENNSATLKQRFFSELDNLTLCLCLVGDALMVYYYDSTTEYCERQYRDACERSECSADPICVNDVNHDYCDPDATVSRGWFSGSSYTCACCADVPIRTIYLFTYANLILISMFISAYFLKHFCHKYKNKYIKLGAVWMKVVLTLYIINYLTHIGLYTAMLFEITEMYNNYLIINLIILIFLILTIKLVYNRIKQDRFLINEKINEKNLKISENHQMDNDANLTKEELKARDIKEANLAKPIVPENTIYDFRINLAKADVSGWRGPNFSESVYFRQVNQSILQSIKNLVNETDSQRRKKIISVKSELPAALVVVTVILVIAIAELDKIAATIVMSCILAIFYGIYFYLRCIWLNGKIVPIWNENVVNNLTVYVQSDLPSLYNIRDPTLVFNLIKLNKNYRRKGDCYYFIRVTSNGSNCPLNNEYEELLVSSFNSEAAKVASNKEGIDVVSSNDNSNNNNNSNNGKSENGRTVNGFTEGPENGNGNNIDNKNKNAYIELTDMNDIDNEQGIKDLEIAAPDENEKVNEIVSDGDHARGEDGSGAAPMTHC